MSDRCHQCGAKYARFPIKGQPNKTFKDNLDEKTIVWKNLFKIDLVSILFIFCVVAMVMGYKADIAKCDTAIKDPCAFCDYTGCCSIENQYALTGGKANLSSIFMNT